MFPWVTGMMFPETLKFPVVSRDETFRVVTFATDAVRFVVRLTRLETEITLRVPTFARGVTT